MCVCVCVCLSAVSLRPRKRVRGTLQSAVGSRELFEVVEEMFAGKGIYIHVTHWNFVVERDKIVNALVLWILARENIVLWKDSIRCLLCVTVQLT